MKFSELSRSEEIGLLHFNGDTEVDLSRPRYDSRTVQPGDVFFALRGYQVDGHKFIPTAIERGARAIVLDDPDAFSRAEAEAAGVARIVVRNSRRALALISEQAFGNPSSQLRMIGVTGTNGKTTTTNILRQLLTAHGEKVGLIGTIGIWIGDESQEATHTTPESRDLSELLRKMVDAGVTTCVMEVSSHALYLDRVAGLDFDIAVFTNLTQDHLDFHPTMEDYFRAKQILFNSLKDTAVAITNADDPYGERMVENTIANSHTYGIRKPGGDPDFVHGHADLMAMDVHYELARTRFTVGKRYSEERAEIDTRLIGQFNVENLLAAIAALYFGVEGFSLEVLAKLATSVQPVRGRFETIQLPQGAAAIIDYAHTPDALENVLRTLHHLRSEGSRIITVFGCGGDRDRTKRPIMGSIATERSDKVIVTSDNPRTEDPQEIVREILAGIADRTRCMVEIDREQAIVTALASAAPGDAVLIAGKGHETYQIVGAEKRHFDDREIVERWIRSTSR